jgi:hypothetical protein
MSEIVKNDNPDIKKAINLLIVRSALSWMKW